MAFQRASRIGLLKVGLSSTYPEEAQRQEASERKDENVWHAAHEPCHASGQALPISEVLSRIDPNGR